MPRSSLDGLALALSATRSGGLGVEQVVGSLRLTAGLARRSGRSAQETQAAPLYGPRSLATVQTGDSLPWCFRGCGTGRDGSITLGGRAGSVLGVPDFPSR